MTPTKPHHQHQHNRTMITNTTTPSSPEQSASTLRLPVAAVHWVAIVDTSDLI
jgi:hypothetical protein